MGRCRATLCSSLEELILRVAPPLDVPGVSQGKTDPACTDLGPVDSSPVH